MDPLLLTPTCWSLIYKSSALIQTDRRTDRQTDRPTKLGTEAPSPELKKVEAVEREYIYLPVISDIESILAQQLNMIILDLTF